MRDAGSLVLAAALVLPLCGCNFKLTMSDGFTFDYGGEQATRTDSGSLPAGLEQIFIENRFGAVQVVATDLDDQGWSWELTTWASSVEVAEAFADEIEMKLEEEASTGRWTLVLPEPPKPRLRGVRSNLTLNVPATVAVEIKNRGDVVAQGLAGTAQVVNAHGDIGLRDLTGHCIVSNEHGDVAAANLATGKLSNRHGSLTAESIQGDLDVHNEHGSVTVNGVSGDLIVRNRHGKIEATGIEGSVDADCQHNDIIVNKATGDVKLRNRHGEIRAEEIRGRIDVENSHGAIELNVDSTTIQCKGSHSSMKLVLLNAAVESVEAATSHASVDVTLAANLPIAVAATAEHGDVQSDFPLVTSSESDFHFQTEHGNVRIRKANVSSSTSQ